MQRKYFQTRQFGLVMAWVFVGLNCWVGCAPSNSDSTPAVSSTVGSESEDIWERLEQASTESEVEDIELSEAQTASVQNFCSDCHAMPSPQAFEKSRWYEKVLRGFEFYARSGRTDLEPPTVATAVRYFRSRAPERIEFPKPGPVDTELAGRFTTTKLDWADGNYLDPAIASVEWVRLRPFQGPRLLVTDMRDGSISLIRPNPDQSKTERQVVGRLGSPARFVVSDINGDGLDDLIVAELGSLNPYDHGYGKLVLFEQDSTGNFQPQPILQGRGRIADLFLANAEDESDPTIVFAEFGHRRSGGIFSLHNWRDAKEGKVEQIDGRPGTVRLLPSDWNEDNTDDFLALVTQEYESVELFHGRSHSPRYNRQLLTSGLLTDGSVGLTAVDLDRDGDQDVLYTHGDCFDDNHAQVNHGLELLVNEGNGEFSQRVLYEVAGAYQTTAADFDLDGDMDIVLVANLPAGVAPQSLGQQTVQTSIVLLEQTDALQFEPHILEQGAARYSALASGDFNADGKMDFVVGTQRLGMDPPDSLAFKLPRLTIWWNEL